MLTGPEIVRQIEQGRITIDPFSPDLVNPNSVNVTLGREIRWFDPGKISRAVREEGIMAGEGGKHGRGLPVKHKLPMESLEMDDSGIVIEPYRLYLGTTVEVVGSKQYIPILNGRSSLGRCGIMVHVTAGFGDCAFVGQWTLEIVNLSCVPWILTPGMQIAQIAFYTPEGPISHYNGRYQGQRGVTECRLHLDK